MEYVTIFIIAVGLAMDAFAVSIVSGATYRQLKVQHAFRLAAFFGAFQALMPLLGSFAGLRLREYIGTYDHWVVFIILLAVGGKMIYESFKIKTSENKYDPLNLVMVLILSVATSIDALAVGFTLSFVVNRMFTTIIIIGITTFALSYMGVFVGKKFGHFFENKIEALGGLILIGIGVKIIIEHLF